MTEKNMASLGNQHDKDNSNMRHLDSHYIFSFHSHTFPEVTPLTVFFPFQFDLCFLCNYSHTSQSLRDRITVYKIMGHSKWYLNNSLTVILLCSCTSRKIFYTMILLDKFYDFIIVCHSLLLFFFFFLSNRNSKFHINPLIPILSNPTPAV